MMESLSSVDRVATSLLVCLANMLGVVVVLVMRGLRFDE